MAIQQFYIGYVSPGKPTQNEISGLTRINCSSTTLLKPQPVRTAAPGCASDPSRMSRAPNPELAYVLPLRRASLNLTNSRHHHPLRLPLLLMFLCRLHYDIHQPQAQAVQLTGLAATTRGLGSGMRETSQCPCGASGEGRRVEIQR